MTWAKLSDDWDTHPTLFVSRSARLLHVEALTFSMRHATDGQVPTGALRRIGDSLDPESDAAELVASGAWEVAEKGWRLVALLDDQPTAEEQAEKRADARTRAERHRRHRKGDHSMCDRCAFVTRPVTRDERVSHDPPSRPDPTRPDPARRAGGGEEGAGSTSTSAKATDEEPPMAKEKHHHGPGCCGLADYPTNRHHWRPSECPGCDDPRHEKEAA